ncbi:TraR/DksA C4-type zinc finger protein [Telmatocola sphagniphila]|uniref:TraR/DksA C4-type zinc finger protein n=1 Tax=Telmatocola sphagniphila TaxID=1123043 RepID=A0A8E6B3G0_9BACT|nr:TraR/DksA C4-type zinc finger protein [Telmatocola sphagniphila]QVL31021.1 TraR/DksA C4-type zinc finger protein [Telmatocola sphagniphila]
MRLNTQEVKNLQLRLQKMVSHNRQLQSELDRELTHETVDSSRETTVDPLSSEINDLRGHQGDDEVTLGSLRIEQDMDREIQSALDRIEQGTYGICEHCSKPISKRRLNALPYARRCLHCEAAENFVRA